MTAEPGPIPARAGSFPTTRWTLVLSVGGRGPGSEEALESLCRIYWPAVYSFARCRGYTADQAQDLTQGYFTKLLEKHYVEQADPARGKFRTFLLSSFKNYLANEWDRSRAQKRGGGQWLLSLDFTEAGHRVRIDPADPTTPESIFTEQWAWTLVDKVMEQLKEEMAQDGRARRYELLHGLLTGVEPEAEYSDLAQELGVAGSTVRVLIHRMRRRFVRLLREEVRQTVEDPAAVDAEIRFLIDALESPAR